jgi:hypothetical protein
MSLNNYLAAVIFVSACSPAVSSLEEERYAATESMEVIEASAGVLSGEKEACALVHRLKGYTVEAGASLALEWEMSGFVSEEVYISVFSGQGEAYYLSTVVPNNGLFVWTLTEDLQPSEDYTVYIEDAEAGERGMSCWAHMELTVLPSTCELVITKELQASAGTSLTLEWEMLGFVSEEVYISVFSGQGEAYYLSTVVPNNGLYEWVLPERMVLDREYSVYIEDAEAGERGMRCWSHALLLLRG